MKFKQSAGNKKMSGAKTANVVIEKLDDATEAGKKNSKFRGSRIIAFLRAFKELLLNRSFEVAVVFNSNILNPYQSHVP